MQMKAKHAYYEAKRVVESGGGKSDVEKNLPTFLLMEVAFSRLPKRLTVRSN